MVIKNNKQNNKEEIPKLVVYSIEDWRNWLKENHLSEKKVGMISHKKHTGKPSISHREAMEEAIAFGWIDTTLNRLDEERYIRYFVKRGENASWSKNTLKYGKELFSKGRMSPFGILRFNQGLKKKPHDYGIPANPKMPEELKKELENKNLSEKFSSLAPSLKKQFYRAILRAKRKETRKQRIEKIIKNLPINKISTNYDCD